MNVITLKFRNFASKLHYKNMRKVLLVFQLLLAVVMANAQMLNPVKVTSTLKTNGSAEAEIVFSCKIQPGWHVYSTGLGADGPISASFHVNKMDGADMPAAVAVACRRRRGNF